MTTKVNGYTPTTPEGRFLSRAECEALVATAAKVAVGGGATGVDVSSTWMGNIRWARNEITTISDVRENWIRIRRRIRGAQAGVVTNQVDTRAIEAAARRAERLVIGVQEQPEEQFFKPYLEPYPEPHVWSDHTYSLGMEERADAARALMEPARKAGMLSVGCIQVAATGQGLMHYGDWSVYHPYTAAQYTVTVRDPQGTGSGWAGMDHWDWGKIDAAKLSQIALEKCLKSRNPVRLEPGRYTTILEPQAVCDFLYITFRKAILDRHTAETRQAPTPFWGSRMNMSKIGERIIDEKITIGADPADPDLGYLPIDRDGAVYHAVDWIKNGVVKELAYERVYGVSYLGLNTGLPTNGAFRMSGGTSTVDEMIADTKRGLLVTRLWGVRLVDNRSLLLCGYTRDGLWLVEDGKVSKPVKNFMFVDSPLLALSNVEMLGVPQRVLHPGAPVVVPALKVREMSFTALSDGL